MIQKIFVIFVVFVLGFSLALQKSYSESETLVIDPGYKKWYSVNLVKGATFSGEFSVKGGSGNDVNFWVEDPSGYQIIQERRVSLDYNFDFKAEKEGTYRIYFDNSMSVFSNKVVSFSYSIQNPIIPGGGCLIATAAYDSELSSQVQLLREIRDNVLFSTNSGTAFMAGFDHFYYSFSPAVADWERQSPLFKEVVRTIITPMLSTLSILNYVNIDSEQEMMGYGIGIILINLGMYFVAPAIVILKLKQRLG